MTDPRRRCNPLPLLLLLLAGCASMNGGKPSLIPRPRTLAGIGDRPRAVVAGQSGAGGADEGEPVADPDGRISGRVVDARGNPVAGAEVRLAADARVAGRVTRTRADAAGGFTLKGLRAGRAYTLVAESEEGAQALVGQSSAEAPSRRVRITVRPADKALADRERDPAEDAPTGAKSDPGEPGSIAAAEPEPSAEETPRPASRSRQVAWRAVGEPKSTEPEPEPAIAEDARPASFDRPKVRSEDFNPLPPAIERPAPAPPPTEPTEPAPRPRPPADEPPPAAPEPKPEPAAVEPAPKSAPLDAAPEPKPEPAPKPAPLDEPATDLLPPAAPPIAEPKVDGPAVEPAPEAKPALVEPSPAAEAIPEPAIAPAPAPPAAEVAAPKLTWDEVDTRTRAQLVKFPLAPTADATADAEALKPSSTRARSAAVGVVRATAQLDRSQARVVDFTLPDLDGRPVRLRDMDAELVLIDFWGTWCNPCLKSVPHLVELQKQFGERKIRVVGVAYEEVSADRRAALVASTARRLGINYTVLIGEADGRPCPLKEGLNVQSLPTMVLLDRTGKILLRETGGDARTLDRVDRMVAANLAPGVVRR